MLGLLMLAADIDVFGSLGPPQIGNPPGLIFIAADIDGIGVFGSLEAPKIGNPPGLLLLAADIDGIGAEAEIVSPLILKHDGDKPVTLEIVDLEAVGVPS